MSKNNVYPLIICHFCHQRIKKNESYQIWENDIYCNSCYDLYMELLEPEDFKDN